MYLLEKRIKEGRFDEKKLPHDLLEDIQNLKDLSDDFTTEPTEELKKFDALIDGVLAKLEKEEAERKKVQAKNAKPEPFQMPGVLKKFMPRHQQQIVNQSEELQSLMPELASEIEAIPAIYSQDGKPKNETIVHAHFFYGQSDWFITEWDKDEDAFGYVILNGDSQMSEYGNIHLPELTKNGRVELDFHWTKKNLAAALHKADPDYFETGEETEGNSTYVSPIGENITMVGSSNPTIDEFPLDLFEVVPDYQYDEIIKGYYPDSDHNNVKKLDNLNAEIYKKEFKKVYDCFKSLPVLKSEQNKGYDLISAKTYLQYSQNSSVYFIIGKTDASQLVVFEIPKSHAASAEIRLRYGIWDYTKTKVEPLYLHFEHNPEPLELSLSNMFPLARFNGSLFSTTLNGAMLKIEEIFSILKITADASSASLPVGKKRPSFAQTPIIIGREATINLPNGEKHKAVYAIVDLYNVIASNDEQSFAAIKEFPTDNDRNYASDKNAQYMVENIAQRLDPEMILSTGSTPEGTPIITADGFVVSGNNRTMSVKLAAKKYPQKYEAYKRYLLEECSTFKSQCELIQPRGIKFPFLVRIDLDFGDKYTTEKMAAYNKASMKAESPVDRGVKLSKIVRENERLFSRVAELIQNYETFSELYSNARDSKRLSDVLVENGIWTQAELPQFYDNGFTAQGKEFVETLLAAMVLNKDTLLATSLPGVKSLRAMIITALPVLVANGNLPDEEGRLIESLNEAILLEHYMEKSKLSFADALRQASMFSDSGKWTKRACYLNRLLSLGRNTFKKAFESYNKAVLSEQNASMFGDKMSVFDIFKAVIVSKISQVDQNVIENSPLVICCREQKEKEAKEAETPAKQKTKVEKPIRLNKAQKEKVKAIRPEDPAPDSTPETLVACKKVRDEFLAKVGELHDMWGTFMIQYNNTTDYLRTKVTGDQDTEIDSIEASFKKPLADKEREMSIAEKQIEAQAKSHANSQSKKKVDEKKFLSKLRKKLQKLSDEKAQLELEMSQKIARAARKRQLQVDLLAINKPEPNPEHQNNRKIAALVNAELKKTPDKTELLEYKKVWTEYARHFRNLPLDHMKALEKIKGAQAKFEGYLGELGQLLGKHTDKKFEGIFDEFVDHFAAIGLILEHTELANIVKDLKIVDLDLLYKKVAEIQKAEILKRTERVRTQLKAFEISKIIS